MNIDIDNHAYEKLMEVSNDLDYSANDTINLLISIYVTLKK